MALRKYRLDEVYQDVIRRARFRAPQRAAFDELHRLIGSLDDDLPKLTKERLVEQCRQHGLKVPSTSPYLVFSLATGVGKTRLMGAIIAYLFRSLQSRNFLILAPRTAIVDKLEQLAQVGVEPSKYLFLDSSLVPEPHLCFRDNLDSFEPRVNGLNVFILSPQGITRNDGRFAKPSEFRKKTLEAYLREAPDLVVFVDEAHHVGSDDEAAWRAAIDALKPVLHFGLTATPRSGPDVNIVYEYGLEKCLQEGLYTKAINVIVDPRDEKMSDDEWDRYTIDYALRRLERKRAAIAAYRQSRSEFVDIEPVVLICARDIDHANEIAAWLLKRRGFLADEVLVSHSRRALSEDEVAQLAAIDQPGNRIRVVINVFRLTEGWDVTNVYVVAPLRALSTFKGAIQTMGRGMRLPAGKRVDDPDLDTLDVLCFGKESLKEILQEAKVYLGTGGGVEVTEKETKDATDAPLPNKKYLIHCLQPLAFEVPHVRQVPANVSVEFDIGSPGSLGGDMATGLDLASFQTTGIDEAVGYDLEDLVRIASSRVIAQLRYLSDFKHGEAVKLLIRRFLLSLDAAENEPHFVDPIKLALHVAEEIHRRYIVQETAYESKKAPTTLIVGDVSVMVPDTFSAPLPLEQLRG